MHPIKRRVQNDSGLSLVEILVTMAIMGLVVAAVYGLYQNTQRTADTSDEVVEVQQNLRIASEWIARDIRMAGFLVQGNPIVTAASNQIQIRMATASNQVASIDADETITASDTSKTFTIADNFRSLFAEGDTVRIVRPRSNSQPYDAIFTVQSLTSVGANELPLSFTSPTNMTAISEGDVVFVTSGVYPESVQYILVDDNDSTDPDQMVLQRNVNGTVSVVANKITGLEFTYLMSNGTEQASVTGSDLANITGSRVLIRGATDTTKTGKLSGAKGRAVEIVIKLRN